MVRTLIVFLAILSVPAFALSRTSLPTLDSQGPRETNDHQGCQESTYCPQGYRIWCYEEGETCDSESRYGEWVWCAGYDEYGNSWESSDYCY